MRSGAVFLLIKYNLRGSTMKKETKLPVFNQYETVSPATKLLEKRRKMYEIHEQF